MIRVSDTFDKGFGDWLATNRRAAGVSRLMLSERIGVSDKAIGQWERGETSPTLRNVAAACAALGIGLPVLTPVATRATDDDTHFAEFMATIEREHPC